MSETAKQTAGTLADIGLIGLAVMGENLALNMQSKGFQVVVYNRTYARTEGFINGRGGEAGIWGCQNLKDFVARIKKPRRIIMMVRAGQPVDDLIGQLVPLLEAGDILIDGGNSQFTDTARRVEYVESQGLLYVGSGVSGGEEGALHGPSLMPGGSPAAWPLIRDVFQAIAAKVDGDEPCCDWVGEGGAGHFVKMVHNGIEYGDMQLIAETYQFMRLYLGMTADEMAAVFREWNKGELDSYLIEITGDILSYREEDGSILLDKILDAAGQKGTGKWTSIVALDEGVALTLIAEAVFARALSSFKDDRVAASQVLEGPHGRFEGTAEERQELIDALGDALYAAKLVSYAQGFDLMRVAAQTYGWHLNFGGVAMMWRGGCIIRSAFLGDIWSAFERNPELGNLLLDEFFAKTIAARQSSWRRVLATAIEAGVAVPAMAAALTYYDGLRTANGPANMIQAQRDYFGAHTYERTDAPRGEWFHTDWTGEGGATASSTYNA
ncbi:MAG: decarboxylating NADP(+)-dependent phosphogluconate dehydrogenase [Bacillota bacterium]|nr:decarboxylating NADP(+)-dependent phosphogluconate dehydrogenase [Bacillota bacterium]